MTVRFARTVTFSCAHRYFDPKLNEDENRRLYGSLYRAEGFGHNFLLEAHFEGAVDEKTGMIVNLADVDVWLKEVASHLDHKHLNQLAQFRDVSPTPERIAKWFYDTLAPKVPKPAFLAKVRLHEGDSLWVDYGV